jgi:hypothetical protein
MWGKLGIATGHAMSVCIIQTYINLLSWKYFVACLSAYHDQMVREEHYGWGNLVLRAFVCRDSF